MSGNENEGSALVANADGDVSTLNIFLNTFYFIRFMIFFILITMSSIYVVFQFFLPRNLSHAFLS